MEFSEFIKLPYAIYRSTDVIWDNDIDPVLSTECFALTLNTDFQEFNEKENKAYHIFSIKTLENQWGHPFLMGCLVGKPDSNTPVSDYLQEISAQLFYASPNRTTLFGIGFISNGERCGYLRPIKHALQTAYILAHMSNETEDPTSLTIDERATLSRVLSGGVSKEERAEIYRKALSKENIDRVLSMPDRPYIKSKLFQLIKEDVKC